MPFILTDPPAAEPLSAADLRARLNIASTVPDTVVNALEKAARSYLEGTYGIAYITQTMDYVISKFPWYYGVGTIETGFGHYENIRYDNRPDEIVAQMALTDIIIPYTPIQKINSIKYLDSAGVQQTLDPATYTVSLATLQARIKLALGASWPTTQFATDAIRISFDAGFGDGPDDVDEDLKMAIVLFASHLRSMTQNNLFVSFDQAIGVGEKRYVVSNVAFTLIQSAVEALLGSFRRPTL